MANGGIKDDNGSQFFFTLGPCTELQKKHTIFAKVRKGYFIDCKRLYLKFKK
jgi:cyclophilin family peptidyl-prolyl cis-trans isomerase